MTVFSCAILLFFGGEILLAPSLDKRDGDDDAFLFLDDELLRFLLGQVMAILLLGIGITLFGVGITPFEFNDIAPDVGLVVAKLYSPASANSSDVIPFILARGIDDSPASTISFCHLFIFILYSPFDKFEKRLMNTLYNLMNFYYGLKMHYLSTDGCKFMILHKSQKKLNTITITKRYTTLFEK